MSQISPQNTCGRKITAGNDQCDAVNTRSEEAAKSLAFSPLMVAKKHRCLQEKKVHRQVLNDQETLER